MAGVGIEIELQGFEALQAKLAALGNLDFTPLLEGVGALMERQTLDRFQAERGPDGQPWRPLKAETVLRKLGGSRRAYGKRGRMTKPTRGKLGAIKILQASSWQGGLISTVAHQVHGDEAIVGANKEYAAIHQFGGAAVGKPGLPARPYLGLGVQDRAEVQALAEKWIAQQLKA